MKILSTLALLSLPLVPALHAADSDKVVSLRCRVFAVGRAPTEELYVKNNGKYQRINISTDYITPSFRIDAKEGIVFFKKLPPLDPKAHDGSEKERYVPAASCAPDGVAPRQLVFFSQNGASWAAVAKSDVDTAFPNGSRLVINMTPYSVGFDFGGTKLLLKAKQSGLLRGATKVEQGDIAPIQMARQSSTGQWVPFLSSVWRQTTDERNILILTPVPGTEEVAVSSVQDTPESKDAEEKKAEEAKKNK